MNVGEESAVFAVLLLYSITHYLATLTYRSY